MHSAAPSANISPLLEGSDMFSAGKIRKDNMVFSIKNKFIPKPMEISKSSIFINLKITAPSADKQPMVEKINITLKDNTAKKSRIFFKNYPFISGKILKF